MQNGAHDHDGVLLEISMLLIKSIQILLLRESPSCNRTKMLILGTEIRQHSDSKSTYIGMINVVSHVLSGNAISSFRL